MGTFAEFKANNRRKSTEFFTGKGISHTMNPKKLDLVDGVITNTYRPIPFNVTTRGIKCLDYQSLYLDKSTVDKFMEKIAEMELEFGRFYFFIGDKVLSIDTDEVLTCVLTQNNTAQFTASGMDNSKAHKVQYILPRYMMEEVGTCVCYELNK